MKRHCVAKREVGGKRARILLASPECTQAKQIAKTTDRLEDFQHLLDTGAYSDFALEAYGTRFKLHKALLDMRCPDLLLCTTEAVEALGVTSADLALFFRLVYSDALLFSLEGEVPGFFSILKLSCVFAKPILNYFTRHIKKFVTMANVFNHLIQFLGSKELREEQTFLNAVSRFITENQLKPSLAQTKELMPYPDLVFKLLNRTAEEPKHRTQPDLRASLKKIFASAPQWPFFSSILSKNPTRDEERNTLIIKTTTEMPIETFKYLLSFFYGRRASLDIDLTNASWIMSLADYYCLSDSPVMKFMLKVCEDKINSKLTSADQVLALMKQ